mgnify:CR=1 FL=1
MSKPLEISHQTESNGHVKIIPMIEKSAYESMAEKAVSLSSTLIEVQRERLDLEAKLKIAVEALERIAHEEGDNLVTPGPDAFAAMEALEKINSTPNVQVSNTTNQWQPIETAPDDNKDFLGYSDGDGQKIMYRISGGFVDLDGILTDPTHWMPLPEPPT